jgi:ComF family protein
MNRRFLREIAALIYPVRCPVCGCFIGGNDTFCEKCQSILVKYAGHTDISGCDCFTAAYEYRDDMSVSLLMMKHGKPGNAPFAFGHELEKRMRECGMDKADMLIPVPMFRSDKRKRGYNQSELIAKELGKRLGIPVCNAVEKTVQTRSQKELGYKERLVNLKGAFAVKDAGLVSGKTVVIIDDICTTGSTLAEISKILKAAGAEKVYCACCTKTMKKDHGGNNNEQ